TAVSNFAAIAAARRTTPPPALDAALDRIGGAAGRYELGRAAPKRDDAEGARRQFGGALALAPGPPAPPPALAQLAYRSGQWDLALTLARGVLADQDDNARANYLAGISSFRVAQRGDARRFLQRAVALAPGNEEYVRALMMALSP